MSYDLCAQKDKMYFGAVSREETSRFVSGIPNVVTNGPQGFIMQRGAALWMEIDLESVSREGDVVDDDNPSPTINCIRFHIPYAYVSQLDECCASALRIADHLGWELYDLQEDARVGQARQAKPWWKFW